MLTEEFVRIVGPAIGVILGIIVYVVMHYYLKYKQSKGDKINGK